jgi:hypothetical protein
MLAARTVLFLLAILLACPIAARAGQGTSAKLATVTVPRVDRAPTLEDFLGMRPNAAMEGRMARVEGFIQQIPSDGQSASQRTEVYVGYDDKHLYVVFVAFDSEPGKVRARMVRRENISDQDDWVEVALDTFHDQRRGFLFDCNPLGVQWDALWSEADGEDSSFDTVWASRGQVTPQGYVVWMAIPFKSLRFPPATAQTWGLIFTRWIARVPEKSTWPHVSSRIQGRMNQAGTMNGLERISPGHNLQFIPYGVFRAFRALDALDLSAPRFTGKRADVDGGLDAKIVMKDSLVLDLALNPDFSQVESDEPQVTVNQRFEVYFPEKRPFFIENSSFFQTPINLLFTRRIADPQFGVRLTGKRGHYSVGALFADDQAPGRIVLPSDPLHDKRAWLGVLRVNRDIFRQSTLGLIYADREFEGSFSRVFGIDGRFKLGRNWVASGQAVTSDTRRLDGSHLAGPAYDFALARAGRQFTYEFNYNDRSPGFRADAGFLPRTDIRQFEQEIGYQWRPEGKFLISWGPSVRTTAVYDHSGTRLDFSHETSVVWNLTGQTGLTLFYVVGRERLRPQDFPGLSAAQDFSRDQRGFAFASGYFPWASVDVVFTWDKLINIQPPLGQLPALAGATNGTLQLTFRPSTRLRADNTYLFARLVDRGTHTTIYNNHILRSKWNYQFTRELSARVILQYEALLPNASLTGLEKAKNFNTDFLLTYLVNPWTALYVGYNSNLQNIALVPCPTASGCSTQVIRTGGFINDARGFFVKFSYLFRF